MEKKHLIIPALVTALLSASAASFAQERYHGDRDRDRSDRYSQRDRDDDRNRQYERRDDEVLLFHKTLLSVYCLGPVDHQADPAIGTVQHVTL